MVRTVLEMGINKNTVMKVLENRLRETGMQCIYLIVLILKYLIPCTCVLAFQGYSNQVVVYVPLCMFMHVCCCFKRSFPVTCTRFLVINFKKKVILGCDMLDRMTASVTF